MIGNLPPAFRLPLLALGFVALLAGTAAGLARFGWSMPAIAASAAAMHGPLMLCGFFGVVISLERAVAIGRVWAYAGPLLGGAGALAMVGHAPVAAAICSVAASLVMLGATIDIQRRQRALFTAALTAASGCWVIGAVWWLADGPLFGVEAWWLAFLVLTIAAERLELSRFLPPSPRASRVFVAIVVAMLAGLGFVTHYAGRALFGAALVTLAVWLVKQDIARRTVRGKGLTRYIAVCLLLGYFWLAASGALIAGADGLVPGTPWRDAAVHALGLGFVFSMVFGHAPVIVPAVVRAVVPYHPVFYLPLAVLHASLAARWLGHGLGFDVARAGAMGNAVALGMFIVTIVGAVLHGRRSAPRAARQAST